MINLDKFMSKKSAATLREGNLHKVAALIERNKGSDIGEEMSLDGAVFLLGKKAYLKSASFKKINLGLVAYNDILNED